MSTRDWSEAYNCDESSVHGRNAIECGIAQIASEAVNHMNHCETAYNNALKCKEEKIKSFTRKTKDYPSNVIDIMFQCDESMKPYPKWVREIEMDVRKDCENAHNEAVEMFMECEESEKIIENIVTTKKAFDDACEIVKKEKEEIIAKDPLTITLKEIEKNPLAIVICSNGMDVAEIAKKTGKRICDSEQNIVEGCVIRIGRMNDIISPRNRNRYIPQNGVIFHNPKSIQDIGFGNEMRNIQKHLP